MELDSDCDLVKKLYVLQEQRVQTYKKFDEGFKVYLSSGPSYDFVTYRQMVNDVTETFNALSSGIISIRDQLSGRPGLSNVVKSIEKLQLLEQSKLECTAQLQIALQSVQDDPDDGGAIVVTELKQRISKLVEEINEQLENIKYEAEELT